MSFKDILHNLPEVIGPTEKKLSFNIKLRWTIIVLAAFFILANIQLYGLRTEALMRFEYIAILLGTDFGSIISLGIGPIVMASIILQLLVGSKILNIDTSSPEGKRYFQGLQKLLVFGFIIFEAIIYVLMGGTPAIPGFELIVIIQLMVGGFLILLMDEVSHKWGFGSGVSLFIAAGVGWRLVTGLFGFIGAEGTIGAVGAIPSFFYNLFVVTDTIGALKSFATVLSTVIIFLIIVWAQSLKIEIPLSYDRLRGYNVKWPLAFFYASNIPVILTGAFIANLQLFGSLFQNWLGHATWLGNFSNGQAVSGLAYWLGSTDIVGALIDKSFRWVFLGQAATHIIIFVIFSAIFSVFWVKTSGMDAAAQARNIIRSGLQIPGFRKDERILESILNRYVMPLTIMGGIAVGLLASISDITGTITGGTALLLGTMIIYQFYQNIAQQHAMDMHPAMRKMM
ncbi:preprotein translocase subunit SecY [Candidatus Pacearchaeota archaeon]|nr:preprotein translocase subunit SecY [Candidatus Pacearchaeota archaeon]